MLVVRGCAGAVEPVVEHDHVLHVRRDVLVRVGDDKWGIEPSFELEPMVRVKPIGPRIRDDKPVGELCAGLDVWLGHTRYAIHCIHNGEAMPMDRRGLGELVINGYFDEIAGFGT